MWNIVLVDDEKKILDGLSKLITHIGEQFQVIAKFNDSEEAFCWIRKHHNNINLLITDINLPKMSGLDLIEKIRVFSPHLPCIILTGYDEFEYAKRSISLNIIDYLLKPVDTEELSNIMHRLLLTQNHPQTASPITRSSLSCEVIFIKNEIENNYQNFSISSVSENLQLSKEHLSRLFKKEMGQTMSDYLFNVRMEQSARLLSETGKYKIYEVCQLVGYEDQVYFTKQFKKKYNVTPKEYQKHYISLI